MKRPLTAWLSGVLAAVGIVAAIYASISLARWAGLDARLEAAANDATQGALLAAARARVATGAIFASAVATGAGTALMVILLGALREARAASARSREERVRVAHEHARLVEAVENLNEGFVLFDDDDRLVTCNRRFRDAYRDIVDLLEPGKTYSEIMRAGALRGMFPEAAGRVNEWVAEKMVERQRFTPHEQALSNDRWLMVSDRPTRDGGFVGVRTDITELKRREFELREARGDLERQAARMGTLATEAQDAKAVLQDAIESINEGFSLYDGNDRLVMCNSRWLDLHARIRDQARPGAAFADILRAAMGAGQLVAHDDVETEIAERTRARRAAEKATLEEQFSDDRWIRVSTRRMANGGIVSVLNDITALKQREFALSSARSRLEKQAQEMSSLAETAHRANRAKSEFLAMMSHEIRTPLNGVISALGLVANSDMPQPAASLVETARTSARSLLTILNDVLDMSKIEAGKLELEPAPFRMRDLVEGVAALCRVQAEAKGLEFRARLADDVPEWVHGDIGRIRQMALNYATNAVKFTEEGVVEFEITRASAGGDSIRFEVIDSGIGIPLEQHGRVFRDFTQLDQSLRRRYGGTGLGLAITRRLARMMGGTIGFNSTPGVGSSFWFEVPLPATTAAHEDEPVCGDAAEGDLARIKTRAPRVLLVEDNDTNRLLARLMLERMGCRVDEAMDGAQAVEATARGAFDVILMDISMPVMDGLEATRRIRSAGLNMPIVALTAHTGENFAAECAAVGMNGRLTKPIDAALLRRRMAAICAPVGARRHAQPRAEETTATIEPAPLETMRETLGADAFARVIATCRADIAAESAAMLSALGRLDEPAAGDQARRAAHKLTSLAATVGAMELSRLTRLVETAEAGPTDLLAIPAAVEGVLRDIDTYIAAADRDESAAA